MGKLGDKLYDWFDERFQAREFTEMYLTGKMVPPHAQNWLFCLGGLAFTGFLIQIFTGMFLMMYYKPTPEEAFKSVMYISNEVPFGWIFHQVHSIGATVMILTVMAHLLRILFMGAYKKPRELHWVSGMLLFLLTAITSFTGYLLPWTQLSYWGATVGTDMAGAFPQIGPYIIKVIRGGEQITGVTLTRFYALHVVALPLLLLALCGMHFVMIRQTGISDPL